MLEIYRIGNKLRERDNSEAEIRSTKSQMTEEG